MRVFIIEAPNPLELLSNQCEWRTLEQICRLIGHEVSAMLVRSKDEFETACSYIGSIETPQGQRKRRYRDKTLILHISAHGNQHGLGVGNDLLPWKDLFDGLRTIYKGTRYTGNRVIVISACGARHQELTTYFTQYHHRKPSKALPKYIFTAADETVDLPDLVVAWTIFYKELSNINLNHRKRVQNLLQRMKSGKFGNIIYHRWDNNKKKGSGLEK